MKIPKQAYTIEFKELAVKRIKDGQSVDRVCKEPGLSDQTLRNWIKAAAEGKLAGIRNSEMLALIRAIHAEPKGVYGSPRMVQELRIRGFSASKERVDG